MIYTIVFITLLILTALTVVLSYGHRGFALAVIIALSIAIIKGGLVGGYFMHLRREKPAIFWILLLALVLLLALLLLPVFGLFNGVRTRALPFS